VLGEAEAIPLESGSVDVVLTVFGVIFASDPVTAVEELARITTRTAASSSARGCREGQSARSCASRGRWR